MKNDVYDIIIGMCEDTLRLNRCTVRDVQEILVAIMGICAGARAAEKLPEEGKKTE
jgi:hypothetical protein